MSAHGAIAGACCVLRRDIAELERLEIIVSSGLRFKGNMGIFKGLMPLRKGI